MPELSHSEREARIRRSSQLVGRAVVSSILVTLVSFAPILFLTGQEEKLFSPLVWTKTFAMIGSLFMAVFVVPVLMALLLKGKFRPESKHPVSRFFIRLYAPIIRWCLRFKGTTLVIAFVLVIGSVPVVLSLGTEFMPALDEGSLLFMPVTLPDVSNSEIKRIMQIQDKIIKSVPEVQNVLGKAGRANTATDNAPLSMIESIVLLKPRSEWRPGLTKDDLINELNSKLQIPGVINGWTQPIINRINMLSTGIRTDVGVKVYGQDLDTANALAQRFRRELEGIEGIADMYVDPIVGGRYLDVKVKRDQIGRYGLSVDDVNSYISAAVGGMEVSRTIEGRQRFSIGVRFVQNARDDLQALRSLQINTMDQGPIPLEAVADISFSEGPPMINSENAMLRGTILFNVRGRDMGSTVNDARRALEAAVERMPKGYYLHWSGQYEDQVRAQERLMMIIPLVLLIITLILFFTFNSMRETLIVLTGIPVALVGGAYSLHFFDINFSIAVAVGFIALFGIAVETGILMLVYLNNALYLRVNGKQTAGVTIERADIHAATFDGAVLRLRPKLMTVIVDVIGLLPVMLATGTGSDVMRPIVIPFVFGLITSTIFVLIVLPVLFALVRERELSRTGKLNLAQYTE